MARKKPAKAAPQADAPSPETQVPRAAETGAALKTAPRSRFTLYNLMGKERAYYAVDRREIPPPSEPPGKTTAHSIIVIDRSRSMYGIIDDTKDKLIKLLTLEEYNNANLLVSLLSYSGRGDLITHFKRAPISDIMKRDSKYIKAVKDIRATGLTSPSQAMRKAGEMV